MARGVWSGVGLKESWEKEGDDGAVEPGEEGRERLCGGGLAARSSPWVSCEWERDMFGDVEAELE